MFVIAIITFQLLGIFSCVFPCLSYFILSSLIEDLEIYVMSNNFLQVNQGMLQITLISNGTIVPISNCQKRLLCRQKYFHLITVHKCFNSLLLKSIVLITLTKYLYNKLFLTKIIKQFLFPRSIKTNEK